MKFLKKLSTMTAVAAALTAASAAQAGVVIDLFTDPFGSTQTVQTSILGGSASSQSGPFAANQVIGGYRDMYITKTADVIGGVNSGTSTLEAGGGVLSLSNADGNKSTAAVTWDGNDADATITGVNKTGLGGVDLTAGGSATAFLAEVFSADLGFAYSIRVWDMDGSEATLSSAALFKVSPGVPDLAFYAFDWFNWAAGTYCLGTTCPPDFGFTISRSESGGLGNVAGIDFTKIGALQLVLTDAGAFSVDFSVGTIETVPEPGALALVGAALLGAAAAGRRRRVKQA